MPNLIFSHVESHDFTQAGRLLKLTTPLGPNLLLAECVKGEDALGQGFCFTVSALSTDSVIPLRRLIGQPVLLQLMTAVSRERLRPFHGHITAVELTGANGGLARYQLSVEPWTAFLALGRDSRVFQNMTVFDIIDKVFGTWSGRGRLMPVWRYDIADRKAYPRRSVTTQYQESDLAFVQRLMHEEDLFYYFEHKGDPDSPSLGEHNMVIADHNGTFKEQQREIAFTQSSAVMKQDSLDRWQTVWRRHADGVALGSWDYRTRSSRPVSDYSAGRTATEPLIVHEPLGAYAYETREQGERRANVMTQAIDAGREVHIAAGTVRTLAPGTLFSVNGHAVLDANGTGAGGFLATRVVHLMHNNLSARLKEEVGRLLPPSELAKLLENETKHSLHRVGADIGERPLYRVRIDAIRSSVPYRTSPFDEQGGLRFARPTVSGQQSAIVVGPEGSQIHTDRDHRIKVQFHWQRGEQGHSRLADPAPGAHTGAPGDDSAGTWVRVATSMAPIAGANWGSHAIPRVGQEVLIDFIDGDIDRPIVFGSLFNGLGALDAQHNKKVGGAGAATANAPAWFPGESDAHAHPASLSGFKSQAMAASQTGHGAYNQLVFDDTPGQSRIALQRHSANMQGSDQLNLGQQRHQNDNARLSPTGFGVELLTGHAAALRAGQGLLLSTCAMTGGAGAQLDAREAQQQITQSTQLQESLGIAAQDHQARLTGEAKPDQLPAIAQMRHAEQVLAARNGGSSAADSGGGGKAIAFTEPQLQLSSQAGIVALTPASVVVCAGDTSSISADQDINFVAQGNSVNMVADGIVLFTLGKAKASEKPNHETGVALHAATGCVSVQSNAGTTSLTADKSVSVASTTKSVTVGAASHLLFTAQGAFLKLEGGNIMLHGPGTISFKAGKKELFGPKDATHPAEERPAGKLEECAARLEAAGSGGASVL